MKKCVCFLLVFVMLFTMPFSLAEKYQFGTEYLLLDSAEQVFQSLIGGRDLHVLVQDSDLNTMQDIALAFHGLDGQSTPILIASSPDRRISVDPNALCIENADGATGVNLTEAFRHWMSKLTGIEDFPVYSPSDGEALLAVLKDCFSFFTDEAVRVTHDVDPAGGASVITISASSKAIEHAADAALTSTLTSHKDTLDPLLKKYGEVLRLVFPHMPLSCDLLLVSWKALSALLPEHDHTVQLTLRYDNATWSLTGHALDWQVDVSWADSRLLAQFTPADPLPDGSDVIIIDSNDLLILYDFALDMLDGITREAFHFENSNNGFILHVDTHLLARDLHTSLPHCVSKHDLQALEARYSYVLDLIIWMMQRCADLPVHYEDITSGKLINALINILDTHQVYHLEYAPLPGGNWQAKADVHGCIVHASGNESSVSVQFQLPNFISNYQLLSLDVSWGGSGFSVMAKAAGWLSNRAVQITGTMEGDHFILRALSDSDSGKLDFNLELAGTINHAKLSGTVGKASITGDLTYNGHTLSAAVFRNDRAILTGTASIANNQISLSMLVNNTPVSLLLGSDFEHFFNVFFSLRSEAYAFKCTRSGSRFDVDFSFPLFAGKIQRSRNETTLHLTVTELRYESSGYRLSVPHELFIFKTPHTLEATYTAPYNDVYSLSYRPGIGRLRISNNLYTIEDISSQTNINAHVVLVSHSRLTAHWYDNWELVSSTTCILRPIQNGLTISACQDPSTGDGLLWRATIAWGSIHQNSTLPQPEPIVPTQWKDHHWLEEYLRQLFSIPEAPAPAGD